MKNTLAARLTLAAVSIVTVAAALTGCSAADSGGSASTSSPTQTAAAKVSPDQSKAEACTVVKAGFDKVQRMQGEASAAMSDPQKALDLLDQMNDTVTSIKDQVGNPEVKAPVDKAAAAVNDLATLLHGYVKNPATANFSAIGEKSTALAQAISDVSGICA
ncbi:hypothetical protein [Leifsonia sp. WHRI 6310E]|uniref:hypothetical protein n=1 Tax=Leifsonia sp. WHRI 6310E TaxID=3162562 RepID=UPI0032EF2862